MEQLLYIELTIENDLLKGCLQLKDFIFVLEVEGEQGGANVTQLLNSESCSSCCLSRQVLSASGVMDEIESSTDESLDLRRVSCFDAILWGSESGDLEHAVIKRWIRISSRATFSS